MQLSEREMISDRQRGSWKVLSGEKILFSRANFFSPERNGTHRASEQEEQKNREELGFVEGALSSEV